MHYFATKFLGEGRGCVESNGRWVVCPLTKSNSSPSVSKCAPFGNNPSGDEHCIYSAEKLRLEQ